MFRFGIEIINGISRNTTVKCCCINLEERKCLDLTFLDEEKLILLCTSAGLCSYLSAQARPTNRDLDNAPVIMSIPVNSDQLVYSPYDSSHPESWPESSPSGFKEFTLPEGQNIRPVQMEVHDKSSVRGETPPRICLLSNNRTTLGVFSMPE